MARLTRVYGSPVIVSETARGRLDPSISWLQLDRLLAENAQQPTGIYAPTELFARKNDLSISAAELQQRLQQAFGFYLSGEWRAAEKSYCEIGECVLSDLFADRCRQFQRQEPDGDWNGVYTA